MPVVGLAPAGNQIKWIWAGNPIEDNSITITINYSTSPLNECCICPTKISYHLTSVPNLSKLRTTKNDQTLLCHPLNTFISY